MQIVLCESESTFIANIVDCENRIRSFYKTSPEFCKFPMKIDINWKVCVSIDTYKVTSKIEFARTILAFKVAIH